MKFTRTLFGSANQTRKLLEPLLFLVALIFFATSLVGLFRATLILLGVTTYLEADPALVKSSWIRRGVFSALVAGEIFLLGGNMARATLGFVLVALIVLLWAARSGKNRRALFLLPLVSILQWGFVFKVAAWPQTHGTYLALLFLVLITANLSRALSMGSCLGISLSLLGGLWLLKNSYPDYVNSEFYWRFNATVLLVAVLATPKFRVGKILLGLPNGFFSPLTLCGPALYFLVSWWAEALAPWAWRVAPFVP